jgi:hypothetical protein
MQMKLQLFFDMPHNYTTNFKWRKKVAMKITGCKKLRVTVMLCVTTDGSKLLPHVILNRKTVARENFPPKKCMEDIGVNGRLA